MIGQKLGTFLLGFWNKIKMMEGFSIKQSKHVQRQIQVKKALILCPLQFRWVSSTYIYHPPETKENNNDRVMHFLKGLALYVLVALFCQNVYEIALQFLINSKFTRVAQLSVGSFQISLTLDMKVESNGLLNLSKQFLKPGHILDPNSSHSSPMFSIIFLGSRELFHGVFVQLFRLTQARNFREKIT